MARFLRSVVVRLNPTYFAGQCAACSMALTQTLMVRCSYAWMMLTECLDPQVRMSGGAAVVSGEPETLAGTNIERVHQDGMQRGTLFPGAPRGADLRAAALFGTYDMRAPVSTPA